MAKKGINESLLRDNDIRIWTQKREEVKKGEANRKRMMMCWTAKELNSHSFSQTLGHGTMAGIGQTVCSHRII